MDNNSASIISKVWSFCNTLRDDGVGYGDYLEQLTYLLFLKMADEYSRPPYNRRLPVPKEYNWESLVSKRGADLELHYSILLRELGQQKGILGQIFTKSQNKIQDPAKLYKLIDMINLESWVVMGADVKGDIYEGLLEKNAEDTKSGAGQYFTPRPLIKAIVDVMRPQPGQVICDPAAGTGGFLLAAHDYIASHNTLDRDQWDHLRHQALHGWEIVDNTARLCVMNLYLHGIGVNDDGSGPGRSPIHVADSLAAHPGEYFDMVLTNPPFGKKSSIRVVNEEGEEERQTLTVVRDDFWASTSNKQLNFVQHVKTLLKINGRAAVVVPDNVLFEGGAGEVVRRKLLAECDVHTLLRLPTGIFYAQGVKANVLFFDKRPGAATPWTKELWIYDLRTNRHFTLKTSPLQRADLDEFVSCFNPANRHARKPTWSEASPEGRWRPYRYDELVARDKASLDIFWLKDEALEDSANLPPPDEIAADIVEDLRAALEQFEQLQASLEARNLKP